MGLGDVVSKKGQSRRMLVVDVEGDAIVCAWKVAPRASPQEREFRASALKLIRAAPGR